MAAKKAPKPVTPHGKGAKAPSSAPKKTASKKKKAKKPAAQSNSASTHYIRNLHSGAGGARIDLQTTDTRIQLEPRGRRGDMRLVTEEIANDPMYQHNLGVIFEEVPIEVGREIIAKQQTNQQQEPSTMDLLRNSKGEKYIQTRANVEIPFEQQGVTVAQVSQGQDGRYTEGNVNINRSVQPTDHFSGQQPQVQQALGPQQVAVPGSQPVFDPDVVPAGLSVEQAQVFIETPREQRLALVEHWRQQAMEDEAYRNQLNVSVQPTEQT
jgi:hypothetical protein